MTSTTRSPEETRAISRLRALSQGVTVFPRRCHSMHAPRPATARGGAEGRVL